MSSPCQDCPYRKLRCHDRCDEYLEWHDALREAKEKVFQAAVAMDYLKEMALKRERKARLSRRK